MDFTALIGAVQSQMMATGYFESVNGHEPASPVSTGVTAAVWADDIHPEPRISSLNTTGGIVIMTARLYMPILTEPRDAIDPALMTAMSAQMTAYNGAFTLGGLVQNVDILGEYGTKLAAKAGYLDQDSTTYRVMTMTVPLVIPDMWRQVP